MKNTRRIAKLVTILFAAVFLFGCTTTVFGANDLVGSGTGNSSSASTARTATGTGARTYTGTGSTTSVSAGTETTGYMPSAVATTTYTKGAVDPATRRVTTQVQTGVFEKILPFVLVISAALLVFWFFFHLQMNQVRYGKSEKYYKELLDFKVMCRN